MSGPYFVRRYYRRDAHWLLGRDGTVDGGFTAALSGWAEAIRQGKLTDHYSIDALWTVVGSLEIAARGSVVASSKV